MGSRIQTFKEIESKIYKRLEELSLLATGLSSPNPPVACIITNTQEEILSEGHTQSVGNNHAEREAYSRFQNSISHNVYVTLEPCSHFGRTPPCLDLILENKPKKLILGNLDPNPIVQKNSGLDRVKNAGIEIVFDENIRNISNSFLEGFFSRIKYSSPAYIIKTATSREGFFASKDRKSLRLTSDSTDYYSQVLRSRVDAIIVGPATTFYDSPSLNYRKLNPRVEALIEKESNPFFKSILGEFNILESLVSRKIYRTFVISKKYFPREEFFLKQKKINEELRTKDTIFFSLDELNTEEEEQIQKITEYSIEKIQLNELREKISEKLFSLGVSRAIVEGGNLLYSEFTDKMTEFDSILKIETPVSISNGIPPNVPKLDSNLIARVDSDYWKIAK
ncbi:MAG: bifunctional diaminohydroxyphosphoribosylaminopyrimidine deaminase/5-amino-6-(5-phosphoribosylamino)uracil reductase [Leptospiraceae bacterium]|nr:bifunctional diaminohydroxyphosphoribosylaminopyrimidine deaminase/5-amino-6-(5-phosphoribosylamino)uracil reductase [Leptospiraceae bacterium]